MISNQINYDGISDLGPPSAPLSEQRRKSVGVLDSDRRRSVGGCPRSHFI